MGYVRIDHMILFVILTLTILSLLFHKLLEGQLTGFPLAVGSVAASVVAVGVGGYVLFKDQPPAFDRLIDQIPIAAAIVLAGMIIRWLADRGRARG